MLRTTSLHGRERSVTIAPAILIGLASLVAACGFGLGPRDSHEAAGVFPPWWSPARVIAAASAAGPVSAASRQPFVVVVRAPQGDVAARLRRAGAWLILDPGLARACGSLKET
ncbi:hypothetical protein ACO2Q3_14250 [Caulobacter sp. KR2-114]|uniref:hypothetical protein n=1 Tax=Caulobacter sp. KR2-114 TaxID=3400912 RepID=UPI003BFDE163